MNLLKSVTGWPSIYFNAVVSDIANLRLPRRSPALGVYFSQMISLRFMDRTARNLH